MPVGLATGCRWLFGHGVADLTSVRRASNACVRARFRARARASYASRLVVVLKVKVLTCGVYPPS